MLVSATIGILLNIPVHRVRTDLKGYEINSGFDQPRQELITALENGAGNPLGLRASLDLPP